MKHLFIINPAAGKYDHTVEFSNKIREACQKWGLAFEIACSKAAGDCTRIARQAAQTGEELRIYACGGDGTLNEVVTGVVGYDNVAVTHLPGGSGNDFIKLFDRPEDFKNLDLLLDADEARFDLIEANGSYSLNICSMGFDARIGTEMTKYKRIPLLSGSSAYSISVVANLIKGIHRHYVIDIGQERVDSRFSMICICNGRWYGGGYQPVPEAEPDDGKLDVLLVRKVSRLQVPTIIGKYKEGRYKDYPKLFRHVSTDRLTIHCDSEEVINLDGEARYGKDVEIRVSDQKLRFFYPKGQSYHHNK